MKKFLCTIVLTALFLCQAYVGYAQSCDIYENSVVFAEGAFYKNGEKIGKITSGEISFSCPIINRNDKKTEVSAILCLFNDGKLVGVESKTKEFAAGETGILSLDITVPEDDNYRLCAYLTSGLNVPYPIRKSYSLTDKNCIAEFKSFSLNGCAGKIDEVSRRIDVTLPAGYRKDYCTVEYQTTEGATLITQEEDFSAPVKLELESEDKGKTVYVVYTEVEPTPAEPYECNFDEERAGIIPGTGSWKYSGTSLKTAEIVSSEEGQYLLLDDAASDSTIETYHTFEEMALPCEVSFKVKYERDASFSSGTNDASYNWVTCSNGYSNKVGGVSLKDTASKQTLMYRSTSDKEYASCILNLNDWIDVKMSCKKDGTVDYYIDGEFVLNAPAAISGVKAINRITVGTTKARIGKIYVDDIYIKQLDEPEETYISQDFEGNSYDEAIFSSTGAMFAEDGVLKASGGVLTILPPSDRECGSVAFDCSLQGDLVIKVNDTSNTVLSDTGENLHKLELHSKYDEDYKKTFYTVLIDGVTLEKLLAPDDAALDKLEISLSGEMQLDNVLIEYKN